MAVQEKVSPWVAGLLCRCPRCGKGPLFDGFLSLAKRCTVCGLDYSFADSGDGPAVFIMLIVGFIVTGARADRGGALFAALLGSRGIVDSARHRFAASHSPPFQSDADCAAIREQGQEGRHPMSHVAPDIQSERAGQATGKSRIVLTLFALAAFGILIALGVWQLQRRDWKNDLIARFEQALSKPPIPYEPPRNVK